MGRCVTFCRQAQELLIARVSQLFERAVDAHDAIDQRLAALANENAELRAGIAALHADNNELRARLEGVVNGCGQQGVGDCLATMKIVRSHALACAWGFAVTLASQAPTPTKAIVTLCVGNQSKVRGCVLADAES